MKITQRKRRKVAKADRAGAPAGRGTETAEEGEAETGHVTRAGGAVEIDAGAEVGVEIGGESAAGVGVETETGEVGIATEIGTESGAGAETAAAIETERKMRVEDSTKMSTTQTNWKSARFTPGKLLIWCLSGALFKLKD